MVRIPGNHNERRVSRHFQIDAGFLPARLLPVGAFSLQLQLENFRAAGRQEQLIGQGELADKVDHLTQKQMCMDDPH